MSVKRVWHGWTTRENADAYQDILSNVVLPGIEAKNIPGFRRVEVLRTEHEQEVEFVTLMTFDAIQDVIDFQGEDYAQAYVPDVAREVLKRWDKTAAHYELIETRDQ